MPRLSWGDGFMGKVGELRSERMGAGSMAPWINLFVSKYEDQVQIPKTHIKPKQGLLATCNPSRRRRQRQGVPGANWLARLAGIGEFQVQGETLSG